MRDAVWQENVHEWVAAQGGVEVGGLEHVRSEAWSTVWRCSRGSEVWWFKESTSANPAEGAVHDALAGLAPRFVSPPIAWDTPHGWLLTRDGGTTMQDQQPEIRGITLETVSRVLRDYAQLQRATVEQGSALLGVGLPDGSPQRAGRILTELAEEMAGLSADDPRCIDALEHERLLRAVATLDDLATFLIAGPIPLAFDHNDLFPRNVFVPRGGLDDANRFFDFAESLWAHPFGSLVMFQWELLHRLDIKPIGSEPIDLRHPGITKVFDVYLAQWQDFTDQPTLRSLASAALQIAPLYRAWTWMQVLRRNPAGLSRHGATPRAWIFDVDQQVIL